MISITKYVNSLLRGLAAFLDNPDAIRDGGGGENSEEGRQEAAGNSAGDGENASNSSDDGNADGTSGAAMEVFSIYTGLVRLFWGLVKEVNSRLTLAICWKIG